MKGKLGQGGFSRKLEKLQASAMATWSDLENIFPKGRNHTGWDHCSFSLPGPLCSSVVSAGGEKLQEFLRRGWGEVKSGICRFDSSLESHLRKFQWSKKFQTSDFVNLKGTFSSHLVKRTEGGGKQLRWKSIEYETKTINMSSDSVETIPTLRSKLFNFFFFFYHVEMVTYSTEEVRF